MRNGVRILRTCPRGTRSPWREQRYLPKAKFPLRVHCEGGLWDDFIFTANPPPRAKRCGMGFASCELAHGELVHRGVSKDICQRQNSRRSPTLAAGCGTISSSRRTRLREQSDARNGVRIQQKRTAWSRAFRCFMGAFVRKQGSRGCEKTGIPRSRENRVFSPCISVFSRRARKSPRGRGRGFRDAGRGGCARHSPRCIRPLAKSGERVRRGSARGRAGRSL